MTINMPLTCLMIFITGISVGFGLGIAAMMTSIALISKNKDRQEEQECHKNG